MAYFEFIDCRIKIQVCVGHFSDGRMRTRTFGIKNVRPDISADDVAAVVSAIARLLTFPVVCARLVRKYFVRFNTMGVSNLSGAQCAPLRTYLIPILPALPSRATRDRIRGLGDCPLFAGGSVPCGGDLRIPPGPEGSNGKQTFPGAMGALDLRQEAGVL